MRKWAIPSLLVVLCCLLAFQGASVAQQGYQAGAVQDVDITLYDIVAGPNGYTMRPVRIVITGGAIPPGPVVPVDPPGPTADWKAEAKAGIELVPEYKDRDLHIKAIAFSLNMLGANVGNATKPVADSVATIKGFVESIPGGDADKWSGFWGKIDPLLLSAKSNAELAAGLVSIKDALEDAMPDATLSGGESYGDYPTYGLQDGDPMTWLALLMKLMPLIIELLQAFK